MTDLQMRVALGQTSELTHEYLTFAKQLGLEGVQMNTPILPSDDGFWHEYDLRQLVKRCADYGLRLEAIENVPTVFYSRAMLGVEGRDQQIENYQKTIRNLGKAGIPTLGYHWMPNGVWRTPNQRGRGGAIVTAWDADKVESQGLQHGIQNLEITHGHTFSEDEMWENYFYFMQAVLPVAEEAGVKLALHPDDPPVPSLGGIARLFWRFDGFKRAMEDPRTNKPHHGLDFCLGCFSEMPVAQNSSVVEAVRYFGERKKIFYVHFRDVQGCVPVFQECFIGEGNYNAVEVVKTLKEVGFNGFIIDDHVPRMVNDSDWNHRGHAHATGYIAALVDAVNYFV